jgi:hypothetical protein
VRRATRTVLALTVCVVMLLAGCYTAQFVADYDPQIDQGITDFQRRMEKHLVTLERGVGTPAAAYARHADFYPDVSVDLMILRARAGLAPRNEITIQQIDLLVKNVQLLEKMHQAGIAANDLPPLRAAFSTACTAIIKFELAKKRGEKPAS